MKTPNKSDIKCIMFDLGSTLIEYENIPWDEMNLLALNAGYNYLRRFSISPPSYEKIAEEYIKIRDKNRESSRETLKEWNVPDKISELFNTVGIQNDNQFVPEFFAHYYRVITDQLTIFDDTVSVLSKLKEAGLKIGLISNTIFPDTNHIGDLKKFGIDSYFDFKIFSSNFGYRKPHKSIYEEAIRLSGFTAEQSIFVGDRYEEDYLGPRKNGIFSILKLREGRQYPEPFPDDIVMINSLNELLSFCVK